MRYKLFEEILLTKDISGKNLKRIVIATIVKNHPITVREDGCSFELFNALGHTIVVIPVPESAIEPLIELEVFSVRSLVAA